VVAGWPTPRRMTSRDLYSQDEMTTTKQATLTTDSSRHTRWSKPVDRPLPRPSTCDDEVDISAWPERATSDFLEGWSRSKVHH
jgi:hypothetical protein